MAKTRASTAATTGFKKGDIWVGTGNPPGDDAHWKPVYHMVKGEKVFYGYKYVGISKGGGGGGGGGSSSSYAGGGGGGGSANPGLSAYIQQYRLIFDNPNAKPPSDLLKKAEAGNWSMAYFKMMVRLKDKAYFRSAEAKQRLADLRSYWGAVLPGTKLNKQFSRDYLRHGWTSTQLQNQISGLPAFRKQYPFWKAFTRAQRAQGAAKQVNPLVYKQFVTGFKDVWEGAGRPAPQGYERLFLKSGLTDEEFATNYSALAQGTGAAQWDVGGLTEQQRRSELFNGKGSNQVRGLLQQALNKQQQYFRTAPTPFRAGEEDKRITLQGI